MAAHELSQPLQTLELVWPAIQEHASGHAEFSELTSVASASLSRMRDVLRRLLDITRLDSGSLRVEEERASLRQVCEDLERRFAPLARKKGLALSCRPCAEVIETDTVLLHAILSNLVTNAIRYTSCGGVFIECSSTSDAGVEIAVHDTGMGMSAKEMQDVFRDFYRSPAARAMAPEGVGLGLGLVQRLAALLALTVTVDSEPGEGSTFTVHVPARKVISAARHQLRGDVQNSAAHAALSGA